ncbi:16366_t:CDS:2, partial [Acaulospora colombiana]
IELVVVQTRGAALNSQQKMNQLASTVTGYSSPPPTTSPARLGSAAAASAGAVSSSAGKESRDKGKASNIVGGIFGGSKEKEREFVADGPGSLSRPGTATDSPAVAGEIIPLGLTNSHTPSINTTITSVTASSNGTISSGTPTTTNSMKSWSTTSLSASVDSNDVTSPSHQSHSSPYGNTATTSMNSAREKERKEKERKEREKREHGEVCGRTTIRKPPAPTLSSSLYADHGSPEAGPEWFEQFLFGDLPSFGNMIIALWRLPEGGKKDKERDGDGEKRPRSAGTGSAGTTSIIGGTTSAGSGGAIGSTNSSSHHNLSTVSSIGVSSTHSGVSNLTDGTTNAARGGSNSYGVIGNSFGAAKGATFVGCVEISLPHFSRGEWVEGFWPVYAHANTMTSGNAGSMPGLAGGIGTLGMGVGAMGLGGMSGIGGVAGALVQVGEMKLKIKVDEEIILPSRAYRNVLDALEKRNYLDVLSDLEQKLRIDQQLITPHIVTLAVARNRLLHDIVELAEREINSVASSTATNTLFRGNTVLTKTMELAMAWYGKKFLEASVGPVIRRMIAEKVEIEVDPSKLKVSSKRPSTRDSFRPSTKESMINTSTSGKDRAEIEREILQEQGVRALEYWCNELWNQIYVVRMECPIELRRLFSHVRTMVEKKFGSNPANSAPENGYYNPDQPTVSATQAQANMDMLPWRAISSFVFLRFIVPAILHPHLFGLCPGMPSGPVVRSLTILAKCTQSLANLNPTVPPKEEYMRGIKPCLERYNPTMVDYLKCVSSLPDAWSPLANSSSFLSGPDKHDRLYVINSLRERLTGRGAGSIPTLWKDAIPLLPYALDVPKHLAILSSTVVRNAKSASASGMPRGGAAPGADDSDWSLTTFSGLCFDVEAQALKSVATLAQGAAAASSGTFGNSVRTKRSTSVSSGFGYYQQGSAMNPTQQPHDFDSTASNRPGSSRGVTPTGPPGGSSPNVTTPTQKHMPSRPWSSSSQSKRPSSARSVTAPAPPSPHNITPP